jgi:hypothetical protein
MYRRGNAVTGWREISFQPSDLHSILGFGLRYVCALNETVALTVS